MDAPNPIAVAVSVLGVLASISRPTFGTNPGPPADALAGVLDTVAQDGMKGLSDRVNDLEAYLDDMSQVRADGLTRDAALAYWINVYNAGALRLAAAASSTTSSSVLRVPGGFSRPFIVVGGEALSMDAIEHAKIRRFKDPRIHGALVCGSVSCPTLRRIPYSATGLDSQLNGQMREFLSGGGASYDPRSGSLALSRVFLWYGGDFVRPRRMPTFLPTSRRRLVGALRPWLGDEITSDPTVRFQKYDWGLRCSVA